VSTPSNQLDWNKFEPYIPSRSSVATASIPEPDDVEWADYAKSVLGGTANLAQSVGWLTRQLGGEDVGRAIEEIGSDAVDHWHDALSDPAKAEISKQIVRKSEDGSGMFGYEWGDASLSTVGLMGAESLIGTAGGMGVGAGLTKVLQLFANPFGRAVLTRAATAQAAHGGLVGRGVSQAAKKLKLVDSVLGGTGFGLGEGAIGGISAGSSVYDQIMSLKPEKLLENDRYKQIFESTDDSMSELERHQYAADTVANEASTAAGWQSGLTTALLGAPMGIYFGRILGGARLSSTLPRGIATGAAGEATQEFFQSGAEQIISNINRQPYEPDLDTFEGALEAAVAGAAAGGLMGGGFGAFGAKGSRAEIAGEERQEAIDLHQTIKEIGGPVGMAARVGATKKVSRKALNNVIHDYTTGVLSEERAVEIIEALEVEADGGPEAQNTGPDPGPALGTDEQIEAEKNKPIPSEEEAAERMELDIGKPTQIETVDASSLLIDAPTYQFKSSTDAQGVSQALKGVKEFQSYKAGLAIVHERDVSEPTPTGGGARYAVDGHQRAKLARLALEAGQPRSELAMAAVIYKESDGHTAESVTRLAALKNIGEQTGSPVDAAKVIREMGPAGAEEIANLPPNHALVKQGNAIAKLSDEAFELAVNEVIPQAHSAIVGEMVADPDLQPAIMDVLRQLEPASANIARGIVAQAITAGATQETTEDLFGEQTVTESLYLERAKVLDSAQRLARRDKATFKTLTDKESAITGTGENKLDRAANEAKISDANRALTTLATVANTKGPVSDALTKAAERVKAGEKPGAVAKDFLATALPAIEGRSADGKKAGKDKRAAKKKRPAQDLDLGDAVPAFSRRPAYEESPDRYSTPKTKAMRDFLAKESDRVVGLSIEDDGVFIYTDSEQWVDDAGAGTFRADTETAAIKLFNEVVQKAEVDDAATQRKEALDKEIARRDRIRNTGQLDMFSRAGKPLSEIRLSREFEVEETGELVSVDQSAEILLRQLDKRSNVVEQLRGCIGG